MPNEESSITKQIRETSEKGARARKEEARTAPRVHHTRTERPIAPRPARPLGVGPSPKARAALAAAEAAEAAKQAEAKRKAAAAAAAAKKDS